MQIQNKNSYSTNYQTQFKGNYAKFMLEPIENSKISKNLTELDICAFKNYVLSKQYNLGITPKDIKNLSQHEGKDFFVEAYDFLTKKLGLDDTVRPRLAFGNTSKEGGMQYSPLKNTIVVDLDKCASYTKPQQFSGVRHELQHFLQNSMLLRHEEYGEKTVNLLVENYRSHLYAGIKHIMVEGGAEEILRYAQHTKNPEDFIEVFFEALDGKSEGLIQHLSGSVEEYRDLQRAHQNNLIERFGIIPKDSALTPKIDDFYQDYVSPYNNADNSVNLAKYYSSSSEQDAAYAGKRAEFEFGNNGGCQLKYLKSEILDSLNDPDFEKYFMRELG